MRLTELNPEFLGNGGEGVTETATGLPVPRREGVALELDCPCGCGERFAIYIDPPMSGGAPASAHSWKRTGDSFETLTLSPSILRHSRCRWHGFIRSGEIVNA